MSTIAGTTRARIARAAACVIAVSVTAVTTTVAATPSSAGPAPESERPCFIVQPRWNTAIDGPVPTCTGAVRQQTDSDRRDGRTAATMADCMDPAHRRVVTTCPYPVTSGDRFSRYVARMYFEIEHGQPRS